MNTQKTASTLAKLLIEFEQEIRVDKQTQAYLKNRNEWTNKLLKLYVN